MDARGLIKSMGGKKQSVRRSSGAGYINGVWVESAHETLHLLMLVQPLTGNEIVRIPEGDRKRERRIAYSPDELKTHDPETKSQADVVTLSGQDFQVEKCEPWRGYFKSYLVRPSG